MVDDEVLRRQYPVREVMSMGVYTPPSPLPYHGNLPPSPPLSPSLTTALTARSTIVGRGCTVSWTPKGRGPRTAFGERDKIASMAHRLPIWLISMLVTTQTRPDQIEASGASRGTGRDVRQSRPAW